MITLGWIRDDTSRWKTFVPTNPSEAEEKLPSKCWYFIPTTENPGDVISKGTTAKKLDAN